METFAGQIQKISTISPTFHVFVKSSVTLRQALCLHCVLACTQSPSAVWVKVRMFLLSLLGYWKIEIVNLFKMITYLPSQFKTPMAWLREILVQQLVWFSLFRRFSGAFWVVLFCLLDAKLLSTLRFLRQLNLLNLRSQWDSGLIFGC